MRQLMMVAALLVSTTALAMPWQRIEPGKSTREEVITQFGTPTRVLQSGGKEVLAYLDKEAIRGTRETIFRVDPEDNVVERIDVFPGPVVDKEGIENTYGRACPAGGPAPKEPCYVKRLTDDFRTYFHYKKLGMAVFFKEDGNTVFSLVFQAEKPAKATRTEVGAP